MELELKVLVDLWGVEKLAGNLDGCAALGYRSTIQRTVLEKRNVTELEKRVIELVWMVEFWRTTAVELGVA